MLNRSHQSSLKHERISDNSATFCQGKGWKEGYWAHAYSWAEMKLSGMVTSAYLSMGLSVI